jgi:shikimate dehydrogenase
MSSGSPAQRTLRLGPCAIQLPGDDATLLFGVLGHPVAHSLSPAMQQAAFDAAGCPARYVRFDVRPAELDAFLHDARRMPRVLRGFNVTIPFKTALLDRVDELDDWAACAGAVNTVVIDRSGRWRGHNTDITGLQQVWRRHGTTLAGQVVVVVGAGGLARAAVVAALQEGVGEIRVLNRTLDHARGLLDGIAARWQGSLPPVRCAAPDRDASAWLWDAAVLVQATPLGRNPDDPLPIPLTEASPRLLVLESLYDTPTPLLQRARHQGLQCADGRELLLGQGAASWSLWMQRQPDTKAMRNALQG